MAFHLACPLTCRKICYCSFGGGRERGGEGEQTNKKKSPSSWATALKLEEIYATAAADRARFPWHVVPFEEGKTVDVVVPSLVKDVKKNKRSRAPDGRENSSNGNVVNNSEEGVPARVAKKAFRGSSGKTMAFSAGAAATSVGNNNNSSNPIIASRSNAEQRTNKKVGGGGGGGGGGVSSSAAAKFRASNGNRKVMDAKTVARSFASGGGSATATTTTNAEQQQQQQPALGRYGVKGALPPTSAGEDSRQSSSSLVPRSVCGLCSSADGGGKDRMVSCQGCNRKYHKNCVKQWAQFRDLFDWNSWVCASCRFCEVCRQAGEANKLMFCKRCDNALHVYCQQPPLKHVPKGPYLCPKHTFCHSCSSAVPGSGMSSKWFLAFTTCDACGRLFAKEKYCPVCLKVYRDSEATPMVRCDSCEHWVHCKCDGISNEMFDRYQSEDDLRYECAACRGECHKVNGLEDAIRELWKRRDQQHDAEQRLKLGAGAGAAAAGGMSSRDQRNHTTDNFSPSDDADDDADENEAERLGDGRVRQTIIVQKNNSSLKGPRQKWIPKSQQKRGPPRQKLLSSVVL